MKSFRGNVMKNNNVLRLLMAIIALPSLNAAEKTDLYKSIPIDEFLATHTKMRLTDDGAHCVSLTPNGVVEIYECATGDSKKFLLAGTFVPKCAPLLNNSNSLLISPMYEKHVILLNLRDHRLNSGIDSKSDLLDARFADQEQKIYFACNSGHTQDPLILYHDVETQKKGIFWNGVMQRNYWCPPKLSCNHDGSLLALANQQHELKLWDTRLCQVVKAIDLKFSTGWYEHTNYVLDQDFHSNGTAIAIATQNNVYVQDLRFEKNIMRTPVSTPRSIRYEKNGKGLIVGSIGEIALISNDLQEENRFKTSINGVANVSLYYNKEQNCLRTATDSNHFLEWDLKAVEETIQSIPKAINSPSEIDELLASLWMMDNYRTHQPDTWTVQNQTVYEELQKKIEDMMEQFNDQ